MRRTMLGLLAVGLLAIGPATAQGGLTIDAGTVIVERADAPDP